MASYYEVEVTVGSGKNLKNVNWKNGDLRPYVVLWVDPSAKVTTRVDEENDDDPVWDARVVVPIPPPSYDSNPIEGGTLYVDVVHAVSGDEEGVKPLVGSAKLALKDVVDEVGVGESFAKTLKLKRPSGRQHGKLMVTICVREPVRHYPAASDYPQRGTLYDSAPDSRRDFGGGYGQQPVGYPPYEAGSQPGGGHQYYGGGGGAPPSGYPYYGGGGGAPPSGYPNYGGGGGAPPSSGYPYYGGGGQAYGAPATGVVVEEEKKSKFGGMGTGLAVGAVAGVLGGLAIAEGVDYVEDKFDDEVAEQVEEELGDED